MCILHHLADIYLFILTLQITHQGSWQKNSTLTGSEVPKLFCQKIHLAIGCLGMAVNDKFFLKNFLNLEGSKRFLHFSILILIAFLLERNGL